jgi:hypothetical protein
VDPGHDNRENVDGGDRRTTSKRLPDD